MIIKNHVECVPTAEEHSIARRFAEMVIKACQELGDEACCHNCPLADVCTYHDTDIDNYPEDWFIPHSE